MTPVFEFDDHHNIEITGTVIVNPADGANDANGNTDIFLPEGTPVGAVETITEDSEHIRGVSLKEGEPSSNLLVNGEEQPSVIIPLGHDVVVHGS
jgi:hypothetical protein